MTRHPGIAAPLVDSEAGRDAEVGRWSSKDLRGPRDDLQPAGPVEVGRLEPGVGDRHALALDLVSGAECVLRLGGLAEGDAELPLRAVQGPAHPQELSKLRVSRIRGWTARRLPCRTSLKSIEWLLRGPLQRGRSRPRVGPVGGGHPILVATMGG